MGRSLRCFLCVVVCLSAMSARAQTTPVKNTRRGAQTASFTARAQSNTAVLVSLRGKTNLPLRKKSLYRIYPPLRIVKATPNFRGTEVWLQTEPQQAIKYQIRIKSEQLNNATKKDAGRYILISPRHVARFDGMGSSSISTVKTPTPNPTSTPDIKKDDTFPYMVGAISTGNTTVVVGFSEAMSDSILNPANFSIVQENVNPEAGGIKVIASSFLDGARMAVSLTTVSQSEIVYRVRAVNVYDLAGNPIQAKQTGIGVFVDPASALFAGTPPSGLQLVDTDGDYLPDNQERRGWKVTVLLSSGEAIVREVTSDPSNPDTDGDSLPDGLEKALATDPRSIDTDDDQLRDDQEFNDIFSEPTRQDSDGDGLYDGLEWDFFKTSPLFADSDGDQLSDDAETILANRNARNADIPVPLIEVGGVSLGLDARFTATSAKGTRDLETKSVESTLTQTENKKYSNSDSHEFLLEVSALETVRCCTFGGSIIEPSAGIVKKSASFVAVQCNWSDAIRLSRAPILV